MVMVRDQKAFRGLCGEAFLWHACYISGMGARVVWRGLACGARHWEIESFWGPKESLFENRWGR